MTAGAQAQMASEREPAQATAAPEATEPAAVVFQAASVLLEYPAGVSDDELALVAAAVEELPEGRPRDLLCRFLGSWRSTSGAERERLYVNTFELNRGLSLYLTERAAGRSARERGCELLRLRAACADRGARLASSELPDYLPLLLEVVAHVPACRPLLCEQRASLEALRSGLDALGSPFGAVLEAVLLVLSGVSDGGRRCAAGADATGRDSRVAPMGGAP